MRAFPDECELQRWVDDGGSPRTSPSRELALTLSAMVEQVMAKCGTLGIDHGVFFESMQDQAKETPGLHPRDLFRITFQRFGVQ